MNRRRITTIGAIASALLLAACGAEREPAAVSVPAPQAADAPATASAPPAAPAAAPSRGPSLPDVDVQDLAGGGVNVSALSGGERPVLVWFFAPHCSYCREEAASVEAFARANADRVDVVGLGTQDTVEEAREFVAEHGLKTPRMLYDPSSASWQQLGVRGQPAAMLFDRDGVARGQWFGAFDEQQVLDIAGAV